MNLTQITHQQFGLGAQLPLSQLDIQFANWLQAEKASANELHLWLAALVNHQWCRGHACLDLDALEQMPHRVLGWTTEQIAYLPNKLFKKAVQNIPWTEGENSPLVLENQRLYLRRAWHAEQIIRTALQLRCEPVMSGLASPDIDRVQAEQWIDELFSNLGQSNQAKLQQSDQRQACRQALSSRLTLVTGGPGTGKTSTVARMLALLQRHHVEQFSKPLKILLAAPTGKAAARLAGSMKQAIEQLPEIWQANLPVEAATLHRLLIEQKGSNSIDRAGNWACDVLVIDEASMVDLEMMARVLDALPSNSRLILLGDSNQLASVEAGAVLAQLCEANWLQNNRVHLKHSHRFNSEQGIGQWARWVQIANTAQSQQGWNQLPTGLHNEAIVSRMPVIKVNSSAGTEALRCLFSEWWRQLKNALPEEHSTVTTNDQTARELLDGFGKVGVLCALREGQWGVRALDHQIARALGLPDKFWCTGRPVMVTRNMHSLSLMNGDIGLCLPHRLSSGEVVLRVAFPEGTQGVRWVAPSRLDAVESVFAMTIHKSQGSEFDHVMLVLPDQLSTVMTRELIYTGLTRAKTRLTWWANQPDVLWSACKIQVWRSGGLTQATTSL
jgi:exodeoxyribonuclease V alpha subunit